MKRIFACLLLLNVLQVPAQKIEQILDFHLQPTQNTGRYYATIEKENSLWHRQVYYVPEASMAVEGWYLDKDCEIPDSTVTWYHTSKFPKSSGKYSNGKKVGIWLGNHEKGILTDSSTYLNGHLYGISLSWNEEGITIDSSNFNGNGSGTQVTRYADGSVASAGFWMADTMKIKRWNYYHPNGKLMAFQDFENGKVVGCSCFTHEGGSVDASLCNETEAFYKKDEKAWQSYIVNNLDGNVPVRKRAPAGVYTVIVQFMVDKTGKVINPKAMTSLGFGMEEEVIRLLKRSPLWTPANQFGRKVNAYRLQPVTFQVTEG